VEEEMGPVNYLQIKLKGREQNTLALGAKVELWCAGEYQFHEQFISRGYASSVEPMVHFGLKNQSMVDSVRITWPAGDRFSFLRTGKDFKLCSPAGGLCGFSSVSKHHPAQILTDWTLHPEG